MRSQYQIRDPRIVQLISTVRGRPELYDHRLPNYRNGAMKDQIWKYVAQTCNMKNGQEAEIYWKNLQHSFTLFYRNELIRLVRANYDEEVTRTIPDEITIAATSGELFGSVPWGYYSDMRFVAPFRVKGVDPELDRLIELAKPIVCSEEQNGRWVQNAQPQTMGSGSWSTTTTASSIPEPCVMDVPDINTQDLPVDDACLRSFFDSLYRSTRDLPKALQRRVKREMLMSLNHAEYDAEKMPINE